MRYVLAFSKKGLIRYTSHLDLMRVFKRAFRRCGIEVEYSKGFNPHPRMGFALPLSLGYESWEDILEFRCSKDLDARELIISLNEALPAGIDVLKAGISEPENVSIASRVIAADYRICYPVPFDKEICERLINDLAGRDKIVVTKKTKSGSTKEIDIKPLIRSVETLDNEGEIAVDVSIDSGSNSNLSPELMIPIISPLVADDIKREDIKITRKRIITDIDCKVDWL